MKNLHLLALLLMLIIPIGLVAETGSDEGSSNGGTYLKKKIIKNPSDRPEMPSLQSILCFYDDGLLIIEFNVSEGECEIFIQTNTGETFYSSFDSSELITTVYTGEFEEAEIELSTEKGNVYYGTLITY